MRLATTVLALVGGPGVDAEASAVSIDPLATGVPVSTLSGSLAFDDVALSIVGDVNGDGFDDVAVGAPWVDRVWLLERETGGVYVFHGGPDGIASGTAHDFDGRFFGDLPDGFAGSRVACAGDVNGDGFDDVALNAWGELDPSDFTGVVYVLHGGPTGITSIGPATADGALAGVYVGGMFGGGIHALDDVDQDGFDDLAVAAQGGAPGPNTQRVFFYRGGPGGVGSGSPNDAWLSFESSQATLQAGAGDGSVAARGDLNGDGLPDVAVARFAGSGHADEAVVAMYAPEPGLTSGVSWCCLAILAAARGRSSRAR